MRPLVLVLLYCHHYLDREIIIDIDLLTMCFHTFTQLSVTISVYTTALTGARHHTVVFYIIQPTHTHTHTQA